MLPPIYDPQAVRPMAAELENVGVKSLHTSEDVDRLMAEPTGTTLLVINSVCGCAAGGARPGVTLALQNKKIPDRLATVFAGVDRDAVERARQYMQGIAPSSPCIALFKDGELVHILERRHIEAMNYQAVAEELRRAFDQYCTAPGPSVPPDVYARNERARQCGSTIPLWGE